MSMLAAALENSWLIVGIFIILIALFSLCFYRQKEQLIALCLINNGGLFGLASLVAIPVISPFQTDYFKLGFAILIELFCVAVFLLAGFRIIRFLRTRVNGISNRAILFLLITKLVFFILNYAASDGQYGIFSDDSRIDFLAISPILSKTRYLDGIIDFIIFLGLTIRCISMRSFRFLDFSIILAVVVFGFLTGSKGAAILLLCYAAMFVYGAFPQAFTSKTKWWIFTFFSVIIFIYQYTLSNVLNLSMEQLLNLSFARFILNGDARLMAFDPQVTQYVLSQHHGVLIAELFRGFAKLLGFPVAEFSLGVYQFQAELGTTNYVGAAGQLTALFVSYGGDFWLAEFVVVAVVAIIFFKMFCLFLKSKISGLGWISAASLYFLSSTLAQGFEAYVQLLPICLTTVVVFWGASKIGATKSSKIYKEFK